MTGFSFSHLLDKFDFPGQRLAWPVKKEMNLGKGHQSLLTHGHHKLRPRSHLISCGSCIWVSNRSDLSRVSGTGK